jgi:hypothetical protein
MCLNDIKPLQYCFHTKSGVVPLQLAIVCVSNIVIIIFNGCPTIKYLRKIPETSNNKLEIKRYVL